MKEEKIHFTVNEVAEQKIIPPSIKKDSDNEASFGCMQQYTDQVRYVTS